MNSALMQIVIDTIVFLELSDETAIDPRAASKQMEAIAFHLKMLTHAELAVFLAFVEKRAEEAEAAGDPDGRGEFLRSLPEAFGLAP